MKALPLGIHNSSYQSAALQVTLGQTRLVFNPGLTCTAQGRDAVLRKEAEERLAASVRRAHAVLITDYQHVDLGLLPQLPSETPLYIKTPETLQDWSAFQEHILPLGATGRRLVMAEGARLQLGEAEVVSAPLQCGNLKDGSQRHLAVTVRGEGRTLAYVSGLRSPLTAAARNHLIAQRPDMLYLGSNVDVWSAAQMAGLARDLLVLVATTGARIVVEGVPLWNDLCAKLLQGPLSAGRITTGAAFLGQALPVPARPVAA